MSEYDKQAADFLKAHSLKVRLTPKGDKCPPWVEGDGAIDRNAVCNCGQVHGDRYRVTISRAKGGRVSFDFWGSFEDMRLDRKPAAYDVLACISGDVNAPDTFEDFCSEYGYDLDSRKAEKTFHNVDKLARRLRAFFTQDEIAALAEIQ